MAISGKNRIGQLESANGKDTFQAFNPENGEFLEGDFYRATSEEVDQSLHLAADAFAAYKLVSAEKRADFLDCIADEIMNLGEELVNRASLETALPHARIEGERGRTVNQLRSFAQFLREGSWVEASIDQAIPDRKPIPKPDLRKMLHPIGPVVVFGASNFPLAYSTAGGDTASALAAGNPVIVKAHPSHLGTADLVAQAILTAAQKTGMPDGVFSQLYDSGIKIGQQLVLSPIVKAVGFTGSFRGGKALFDLANSRKEPIPVYAEMGSINPVIFLPNALKNKAQQLAELYGGSITLGLGQFCTNPGLMLGVKGSELNNYLDELSAQIKKAQSGTMLNKNIAENYHFLKNSALVQNGVVQLAESYSEVHANQAKPTLAKVSATQFLINPSLHEEVFGPYSLMIECDSDSELEEAAKSLQGQLTVSVMGDADDLKKYAPLIEILKEKTGRLIFNGVPTGVEVCPSMHHGGPFPATTDSKFSAVGIHAIKRFARPIAYQNWPQDLLPPELQNANPKKIWRFVDSQWTNGSL